VNQKQSWTMLKTLHHVHTRSYGSRELNTYIYIYIYIHNPHMQIYYVCSDMTMTPWRQR